MGLITQADQPTAEQLPDIDELFPDHFGQSRVMKLLGKGGMGNVYLAEDPALRRRVAIKTLKPELACHEASKKRFLREACIVSSLKHEHIVTIYAVGEEQGIPYLAMEYLEGQSLEEMIQKKRKLTWVQIMRLGREIARGLAVAHENGLIHRDVKPANIWLELVNRKTGKTRLKLLDFGLARYVQQDGGPTQDGMVVGTPHYVSPEQARGRELDPRSDLFSLGVVLYRLSTKRYPFEGVDTLSLLTALAIDDPRPLREHAPDVPPAFDEFVLKLLAKHPDDRPASAGCVADRLQELYYAESGRTKPTRSESRLPALQVDPDSPDAARKANVRQPLTTTLTALIALCSLALIVSLLIKLLSL